MLSLSTDGIFTFSKFDQGIYPEISTEALIDFLLNSDEDESNEKMLFKKLIKIEKDWGLKPTDDLGIVRIKLK